MVKSSIFEFLNACIDYVVFSKENPNIIVGEFIKEIDNNEKNCKAFISKLENVKQFLKIDLAFFMDCDPAIDSEEEVIAAYPGYKAITYHRIAHVLRDLGYALEARVIAEKAHTLTGIDIHPAASIACPFFIDHGTGIVIGETSVIGKNVKLYQGVTLGALSLSKGAKMKGIKRHPTIGSNVTIYANATILGDVKIGNNVTIGGSVFLMENVPDDTRVTIGKPELIVEKK